MTDIPHFDLPFRTKAVAGKTVTAEVEQDSLEDIVACIGAAVRTERGFRPELPTFGVNDIVFQQLPVDISLLQAQLEAHEPRADLVLSEHPDTIDALVDTITVETSLKEDSSG